MSSTTTSPAREASTVHEDPNPGTTGLRFLPDVGYAVSSGADLRFDFYQALRSAAGQRMIQHRPERPTPVLVWLPPEGIEEFGSVERPVSVDNKFPSPVAPFVGFGFAVVAASYASQASQEKDLALLLDYLRSHAEELHIDVTRIGRIAARVDGYVVDVLSSTRHHDGPSVFVPAREDRDFSALLTAAARAEILDFLGAHLGVELADPDWDPMSMPTSEVAWVDPCLHTADLAAYRLYPTPRRGRGTSGSYVISLPDEYAERPTERFPVIYYLHGGGGNQREGRQWLARRVREQTAAGTIPPTIVVTVQALPVGWFVNGNHAAEGVLSGPVEDVFIQNLLPHIDSTYRTIADRAGRGLEGWSAGGFGALRLAFKYPELFGRASSIAGAVIDFEEEPNAAFIAHTFGPPSEPATKEYFDAVRPQRLAEENAATIAALGMHVRLVVGDGDWLFDRNGVAVTERMSRHLLAHGIDNTYMVVPGASHMINEGFADGSVDYPGSFWSDFGRRPGTSNPTTSTTVLPPHPNYSARRIPE